MASQTYLVFHPTIWSPRATQYFLANLQAGKVFDNFSDLVEDGGNTIHIPTMDLFSVSSVGYNTGEVDASAMTDTRVVLNISRWMAAVRRVSNANFAQMARSYRLRDNFIKSQSDSIARFFDRELLNAGIGFTLSVGGSTTALGSTVLESAIQLLHSNSIPIEECVFFLHPSNYWKYMSKVSKFYDASIYGTKIVSVGANTAVWGVPVVLTAQIDSLGNTPYYRNYLAHKSALGYAFTNLPGGNKGISIETKESEYLRKTVYAHILYGVKCIRPTAGVRIYTRRVDSISTGA